MANTAGVIFSLSILIVSFSESIFAKTLSIDCGASTGYHDNITELNWVTDGDYVRGGKNHNVSGGVTRYATLRAFPEKRRRKNCYTIPVGAPNTKVFVRTGFFYGNYDGKKKPPVFQLLYDSNDWTMMQTWINDSATSTITYFTTRNVTDICVARLYNSDDPFISFIHVATLDTDTYGPLIANLTLWGGANYAFGSDDFIRSPDDPYDRWWFPIDKNIRLSNHIIQHNNATVNTSTSPDNPPTKMFHNAISPNSSSESLTITTSFISITTPIYVNMYFTEISPNTNGKRIFNIYRDDQIISTVPVKPPYGDVLELLYINSNGTQATTFSLVPTVNSTLPPIISGLELLYIYTFSTALTYAPDVEGLTILQNQFKVLQDWTGDPCLPTNYNWDWVNCSTDDPPRITKLSLAGYGLIGSLPDFSGLDALEIIDLHNNSLSGSIPEFLGQLLNLQILNLEDNNFNSIPTSLTNNKKIKLIITGNPALDRGSVPPSPLQQVVEPPLILNDSIQINAPVLISLTCLLLLLIVRAL